MAVETTYKYHLAIVTDKEKNESSYGYDEMGNRISLTYPGGEIVRYAYDKCGNLTDVTDPSGRKTHYEYDDNGRLTKTTRPDGSTESYEYDLAGRITRAEDKKGGATIHCYQYTYDLQGNIIKITESGNTGDIGALASASMTYTQDNRLDTYNGQKVTYDLDGNMTYGPLNGVMTSFTYDCRNRLIKAGDTTYEYDAENTRTAVQTKDRREEYTVDKEAAYSQVLSITTYGKNLLGQYTKETGSTIYTYGNGLISQEDIQKADTGSGTPGKGYYLYHYNQVGSTTQVTDETGNSVYRYAYSPYGERMGTYDGNGNRISDDTPIRFLYNGRFGVETDQNGLYYMRARYYNTDIKRFLNRDILSGSIENSQSLNQYSYVQGNPVSLTDPFGLCPEGGGTENVKNLLGHTVLDILGFVPVIGFAFDIANCIWYAKEKNGLMAASCFIAAIPGAGDLLGTGVKWLAKGEKAIKTAQAVRTTFRMVGAIAQTGLAAINLGIAMYAVKEEYQASYNGRVSTLSLVNLGASVLAVAIGIHSSKKSIQNFKSMWNGMRGRQGLRSRFPENPNDLFPDNYAGLEKEVKPDGKINYTVQAGDKTYKVEYHPNHTGDGHYDGNHYHVLKLGETPKPGKTKPPYFRIPNLDPNTPAQGGTFAPGDLLPTKNRK